MTLDEIKNHFGTAINFHLETGMSHVNYYNWADYGYIPIETQVKLQWMTNGVLKADHRHGKPLE